jgi:hypothetical protein
VNLRYACLLMSIATAACAAHAQGVTEGAQPTREALSAKPVPWKTGSLDLVPTTILHLQVIITPGFERGQNFAWFTRGGREVVVVFSATNSDVDEMSDELNRRYFPEEAVPGDKRSFIIFGTYKGPGGPPPPDPGGFPVAYVELVMKLSFDVNIAQIHLDDADIGTTK